MIKVVKKEAEAVLRKSDKLTTGSYYEIVECSHKSHVGAIVRACNNSYATAIVVYGANGNPLWTIVTSDTSGFETMRFREVMVDITIEVSYVNN